MWRKIFRRNFTTGKSSESKFQEKNEIHVKVLVKVLEEHFSGIFFFMCETMWIYFIFFKDEKEKIKINFWNQVKKIFFRRIFFHTFSWKRKKIPLSFTLRKIFFHDNLYFSFFFPKSLLICEKCRKKRVFREKYFLLAFTCEKKKKSPGKRKRNNSVSHMEKGKLICANEKDSFRGLF